MNSDDIPAAEEEEEDEEEEEEEEEEEDAEEEEEEDLDVSREALPFPPFDLRRLSPFRCRSTLCKSRAMPVLIIAFC